MRGECLRAWMLPIATYPTAHRRGRQRLFPPSAILSSWPSRPPPFLRLLPPARIGVGLWEKISVQYRWGNIPYYKFFLLNTSKKRTSMGIPLSISIFFMSTTDGLFSPFSHLHQHCCDTPYIFAITACDRFPLYSTSFSLFISFTSFNKFSLCLYITILACFCQ